MEASKGDKLLKRLGFTMGDRGGIGPEIVLKALSSPDCPPHIPVIYGDPAVLEQAARSAGLNLSLHEIRTADDAISGRINVQPEGIVTEVPLPKPSAGGGKASVACIRRAVQVALSGGIYGIVTAPISKESLYLAGYPWPGHTELLAELTSTADYAMMLVGGPLRVVLVTTHVSLRRVASMITEERVLSTIRMADRAGRMLGFAEPRIGVAGLNPHAGEAGVLGDEEGIAIRPAVVRAAREGSRVSGPVPPDVVFRQAYRGDYDLVVVMYHDQGLIPLKMIAFESGVNVTVGLPIIRTSPDHGTAFDIAGKGVADPRSMVEAIKLALRLEIPSSC